MTSEEMVARADRIASRNALIREERMERAASVVNPDRRGFNMLEVEA